MNKRKGLRPARTPLQKLVRKLKDLGACSEAIEWVKTFSNNATPKEIWLRCPYFRWQEFYFEAFATSKQYKEYEDFLTVLNSKTMPTKDAQYASYLKVVESKPLCIKYMTKVLGFDK